MLDVHPPHAPTHTWRDFFIHIATITIGLLIAVSLEQTVETIHHHHQRHQLEEQIRSEAERNIAIVQLNLAQLHQQRQFIEALIVAINKAPVINGRIDKAALPPPKPDLFATAIFDPDQTAWTVAKASGSVGLLPEEEAQVFARLDHESVAIVNDEHLVDAQRAFGRIGRSRQGLPAAEAAFFTVPQRDALLQAASALSLEYVIMIYLQLNESGACRGVLHGARSFRDLRQYMFEDDKQAANY